MEKKSKDNLIWIPIYLGDYMKQTQDYDAEQCGLYLNFVVYYANKKGEVSNDAKIYIPCKAFSEDLQIKLKKIIKQHFTENKGKFVSEYWDKIIEKQLHKIQQARENVIKRYTKEPTPVSTPDVTNQSQSQNQNQNHNTKSYYNPPTPLKSGGRYKSRKEIDISFIEKKDFKELFERWLNYRKEIRKPFSSADAVRTAYKNLVKLSNGDFSIAEKIVEQSIGNQWQGLFRLKEDIYGKDRQSSRPLSAKAERNKYAGLEVTCGEENS